MADESALEREAARLADEKRAALALFARRVAHDMNNYVAIVRTYGDLLMEDAILPSMRNDLAEICRAADSMVDYLRHIIRFSRVDATKATRISVETTVAEALVLLQQEEPGVPVFVRGSTTFAVSADGRWFADVVRELVRNAREASPEGCPVVVHLGHEGDAWVIVRVSDEGAGFAENVDATAEDPFVTTKHGVRGAGFGLTLASAFAHHAGGKLVRERSDERTHVSMWLPAL